MLLLWLHLDARHANCIGVKIQQSLGGALLMSGKKSKSRLLQLECFEEYAGLGRRRS